MIKLEKTEVIGWEHAIRGMRNPMNSWEKSDSWADCYGLDCNNCKFGDGPVEDCPDYLIGNNDHDLMMRLVNGGPVHAKYRRMIVVYVDITAPLYWWKEFDTYKVGTVANSCSTMHKIHEKEFTLEDFSVEHLDMDGREVLEDVINVMNTARAYFNKNKAKNNWWQMIQLLPSSYNQKRTVMLNYEVLAGIYPMRRTHKLDEWREFCKWIESLPYSEIITGETGEVSKED